MECRVKFLETTETNPPTKHHSNKTIEIQSRNQTVEAAVHWRKTGGVKRMDKKFVHDRITSELIYTR